MALKRLLQRWTRQQDAALERMNSKGSVDRRLAGFSASERLDAKFLLLAAAPFAPLLIADQQGWSGGLFWQVWLWLAIAWAVVIVGVNLAVYVRAFVRSLRRKP